MAVFILIKCHLGIHLVFRELMGCKQLLSNCAVCRVIVSRQETVSILSSSAGGGIISKVFLHLVA